MYRDGCFVTSVGKQWGAGPQNVDIGCGCGFGAAIHEICHALGMWHERSRPDRDDYVRVLWDNIPIEKHHNYRIRNVTLDDYYVDSHGIPYDYASIMHSGFSKEGGLPTMEIANREWYKEQGYPALGSTGCLSLLDAAQLNRLYNCLGSGLQGGLRIHIGQAENLQTSSNIFVQVRATNDSRMEETQSTRSIMGTGSPNWDEWLEFGEGAWQYIEINIVQDTGEELTRRQLFSINPGNNTYQHSESQLGSKNLTFSTYLEYECPCLNGGSCVRYPLICTCTKDFLDRSVNILPDNW